MESPYKNQPITAWKDITESLIRKHPIDESFIIEIVLTAWNSIVSSKIAGEFQIGKDIFPKPQIMGFLLHEVIPLYLKKKYPENWREDRNTGDKDLVYIPDNRYSIEIKTSSSSSRIYGNRSYAQEATKGKKMKSGYYLAINFEKYSTGNNPRISLIRFGWLDAEDWIGQNASTGQQARLGRDLESLKLKTIYHI
jgi:hypothetical protein